MKQEHSRTQVIILGGGITGLSAALFLAQQKVRFILVEKHSGTSIYPRARTIDIRTMELFRSLGLSEALREGGKALAPAWGIIRGNTLVEALQNPVGKITPQQMQAARADMRSLGEKSPETVCRCTQDISEAIIAEAALEQGSDLRFSHQVISCTQDENEVAVRVKNRLTSEEYTIAADYMIAADGANSAIREQLAIPTYGNIPPVDLLNIYFEANLEDLVKDQPFSQFLVDTPDITGFLLTINNKDRWAFHLRYHPEKGDTPAGYPAEKIIAILHTVSGIPNLSISILKVLPWQLTVRIAERIRSNRIFLAGDAAHTMTPYAGKGASTGIQDVQNLAWKLAAVLQRNAKDALLDTYQTERQPVGAFYATLSGELAGKNGLINDSLMAAKVKELMGLPVYGYSSSAVDREPDVPFTYFTGEPGTRLPHLWLDEAQTLSTLDQVKGGFVLITTGSSTGWQHETDTLQEKLNLPVRWVVIEETVSEAWQKLTGTTKEEALLVRPDDFIAARITTGSLPNVDGANTPKNTELLWNMLR